MGNSLQDVPLKEAHKTAQGFVELAVRGLPQMVDQRAGIFCHKMKKAAEGLVQEGVSPRYTAMTLLGFHRLEQNGGTPPVDSKAITERLLSNLDWADNLGDVGVALWAVAQIAPERLGDLERRLDVPNALARFSDAADGITMHLAWFLTGLSYDALVTGSAKKWQAVARQTYELLIANQGKFAYFSHQSSRASLKAALRGHIGSFADQVYPIYGMTQYFRAFGDDTAMQRAGECASAICEAQGPLGQWWWHYDAGTGRVFEEYPVFSVHQHGMAPMTLFACGKASGTNYEPWIHKGLDWIDRRNELSVNMQDDTANVIWRCIGQNKLERVANMLRGGRRKGQNQRSGLSVLHECRPYELGWLLYGLAHLLG